MPENDEQDVSAGAQASVETEREQFERERMTRRQALKRFGMTSAMATFALFSVDDLARMVGKAMQQRASDSVVAEQVAKEFQQAGIAMATNAGPLLTSFKCSISGFNCHDASECNPNKFSWIYCPPCGFLSGCVGAEIFNCHKGDLDTCMQCCTDANNSCLNSKASGYNSQSCNTLFTGCQTNCGKG